MKAALIQHFTPIRYARLSRFAGFSATGEDVETFLQGQLTNDVKAVGPSHWQRTGYCTPKGRLLATFVQWQINSKSIGHLLPTELLDTITKRLRMFVLRSKVLLERIDAPLMAIGLWGVPTNSLASPQVSIDLSGDGHGPWLLSERPCPVLGNRCWLIFDQAQREDVLRSLAEVQQAPEHAWLFSEIQSAQAWVWKATQEAFVPQMINFEITGGVSFTKGCYPGQEVVARSQYLGKLKRRTFRTDLNSPLDQDEIMSLCGQDIWSSANVTEPCGQVVNAAPRYNSAWQTLIGATLLVECSVDAWDQGALRVASPEGTELTRAKLPYDFPAAE